MYSILGTDHYYGTNAERLALTPRVTGSTFQETDGLKLYYQWDGSAWIQPTMGGATVWVDIDFPLISRVAAAGAPSQVAIQGNILAPQWAVNDALSCESEEFLHGWKEATALYWHIHLFTNGLDASNRYVQFSVEYTWANINGVLSAASTVNSGDLLIPANTTTKTHLLFNITNFTPAGGLVGGHCLARLKRIASTGLAPTSNPWVTMLQAHVQCDTTGSKTQSAK